MGDRDLISEQLAKYDASKKERHDPGQLIILFDNRIATTKDDRFSTYQSYWTAGLYRLGWPSLYKADLDPGNIRLVWYTVRIDVFQMDVQKARLKHLCGCGLPH